MQSVLKKAEKIKVTAAAVQAVSLSSNQVGISGAYFVIATTLHPDKWINPNLKPSAYKLYVNPEIIESSKVQPQPLACSTDPLHLPVLDCTNYWPLPEHSSPTAWFRGGFGIPRPHCHLNCLG